MSLHDTDARPIAKGRLGKPVEFGYKAQVVDNKDGLVLDYSVEAGNPPDAPQLAPAIQRITNLFGRAPKNVAADRGYNDSTTEAELGVAKVGIPRKGKPSAVRREHEHQPWFRRLVIWRTGCEARISRLKNGYGMNRTLIDGIDGARTWCGWALLTHNAVVLARLTDPTVTVRWRRSRTHRHLHTTTPPIPTATGPRPNRYPSLPDTPPPLLPAPRPTTNPTHRERRQEGQGPATNTARQIAQNTPRKPTITFSGASK